MIKTVIVEGNVNSIFKANGLRLTYLTLISCEHEESETVERSDTCDGLLEPWKWLLFY